MTYTVHKLANNCIRFVFSFSTSECSQAIKDDAKRHSKESLKVSRRQEVIGGLLAKAYSKAANEYPEEIYYMPEFRMERSDMAHGLVCSAKVQVSPVFKLGDYRKLKLTAEDEKKLEQFKGGELQKDATEARRYMIQDMLIEHLSEITKGVVPQKMIDERAVQMLGALEQNLANNGQTLADYYKACETDEQGVVKEFAVEAKKQLHKRLSLYALAEAEGLLATDAEYEAELLRLSGMYLMPIERIKEVFARREGSKVRFDIAVSKAAEFIGKMADKLYPSGEEK